MPYASGGERGGMKTSAQRIFAVAAWLLGLGASLGLSSSATAQQQPQQDPFGGRLGVVELTPPPAEAARQAVALGQALNALAPQRPGQQDVYVIAASLWGDPVFEREAVHGAAALSQHLGAEGRTIVLSAGAGTAARTLPAATPNALAAAIGQVGSIIDPDEDLVAIFITSHGAPDGSAVMRENGRLGASLRPVNLRDLLAQARIRNRVVIISACFSGAFIAPLMDERTVVLTAAASDRTSFGCQPEREWTFFGDALFAQSLPNDSSLIAAFDHAKGLIAQWERERRLTPPSNPQRYVGARGGAMLAEAERAAAR